MLQPSSGQALRGVLASPRMVPAPRQGPEGSGSVTSRPVGDRCDGCQRLSIPLPSLSHVSCCLMVMKEIFTK